MSDTAVVLLIFVMMPFFVAWRLLREKKRKERAWIDQRDKEWTEK
jgi:hypothetical protein